MNKTAPIGYLFATSWAMTSPPTGPPVIGLPIIFTNNFFKFKIHVYCTLCADVRNMNTLLMFAVCMYSVLMYGKCFYTIGFTSGWGGGMLPIYCDVWTFVVHASYPQPDGGFVFCVILPKICKEVALARWRLQVIPAPKVWVRHGKSVRNAGAPRASFYFYITVKTI